MQPVRAAYADFDFKRIFAALNQFMTVDLSAFYFDIRKDALYCDPISSPTRKACLTVIDQLFRATVAWLAPMLCFTAEEAWLSRHHGGDSSVHLEPFPDIPPAWRDEALARAWGEVRRVRRVVTGALEIERADKRIGSSLEAAPSIHIADPQLLGTLAPNSTASAASRHGRDRHHLGRDRRTRDGPAGAFRLDDVPGVAVDVSARAAAANARVHGKSCRPSGPIPTIPDVTPRDAQALREWDAAHAAADESEWPSARRVSAPARRGPGLALAVGWPCGRDRPTGGQAVAALWFRPAGRGRVALTPFLDLVLAWNTGISYGLFQQAGPLGQWALFALKVDRGDAARAVARCGPARACRASRSD